MLNKITIESKYPFSFKNKKELKKYHLIFDGLRWEGYVSKTNYNKLVKFCKKNNYKLRLNNNFTNRSTDYRRNFFKNNPPLIKNKYFCAYCGTLINKNEVTIDHLYPVNSTKKSLDLQKRLKRKGFDDINDVKNLVPACYSCNSAKSDKMGAWIIRGQIGRFQLLWIPRHILRLIIIILCFQYMIAQFF